MHRLDSIARQRVAANLEQILESLRCAHDGNPLAAENTPRLVRRFIARNQMTRQEAEATVTGIRALERTPEGKRASLTGERAATGGAEALWGGTIDFVGVAFLERGRRAARSVARVAFQDGRARGSGFMITDRLFLTNHHVIPTAAAAAQFRAEFDYEEDCDGHPLSPTCFAFDSTLFFSNGVGGLDFTLIGIGHRLSGDGALSTFGFSPLSDSQDKHAIGEYVNIIQHPRGRYKEVVLRENQIAARSESVLHYVADTEPGSSGSPAFNSQWQPVALHHWGEPFRLRAGEAGVELPRTVNEGIRISAIVKAIRAHASRTEAATRVALETALRLWDATPTPGDRPITSRLSPNSDHSAGGPRLNPDGSTSWIVPVEINVRMPMLSGSLGNGTSMTSDVSPASGSDGSERSVRPSDDFSDRDGYEPGFIPGFVVPLPKLSTDAIRRAAAKNLERRAGRDPFELPYHHFSVVVNATRKLAFFTACNIDGVRSKYIDRDSGQIEPLNPANPQHGLMERIDFGGEGAEASESWFHDDRILTGQIANQDTYAKQEVPGFPDTRSMGRTLRMFQRGHLVRRLDPTWGTNDQARLAEADTFHFTNCTPQVGFFNMGQANPNLLGTGGGKLWRAIENLVLRNARNQRGRVCSFTGPIFKNSDRAFRTIKVPSSFFKVAAWADDTGLHSLGMIADQSRVIGVWPESLVEGAESINFGALGEEAFQDPDELARVDDFLTTIAFIESETGLDFGDAVRGADIRGGESNEYRPERLQDVPIVPKSGSRFRTTPGKATSKKRK